MPRMPHALDPWPRLQRAARIDHTPCGGGTLAWHRWGEGRPLVLLHGGSGSWNHWLRNIDALVAAGREVVAPDLPGFGDSHRPDGVEDADGQLPWLEDGARRLFGNQALQLVGFSFGGLVSAMWAEAHPARVAGLVLVGAPALSTERLPPLPLRLWERADPGPARDAIHRHNLRTLMLVRDESVDALALGLHAANLPRDRLRRRRLMLTDRLAVALPRLACPVAGIWGKADVLYRTRLDLVPAQLARAPKYCGLWMLDGGHWIQHEAAADFDRSLAEALATLDRGIP